MFSLEIMDSSFVCPSTPLLCVYSPQKKQNQQTLQSPKGFNESSMKKFRTKASIEILKQTSSSTEALNGKVNF